MSPSGAPKEDKTCWIKHQYQTIAPASVRASKDWSSQELSQKHYVNGTCMWSWRSRNVGTGGEPAESAVKGKTEKGRSSVLGVLGVELTVSHLKKWTSVSRNIATGYERRRFKRWGRRNSSCSPQGRVTGFVNFIECIFQCISNKMQRYTVYLYLETALHISGGISTHHQEHTQLYLQQLVPVKPLLLPADIVEEMERQFQLFHDSGR